MRVLLGLLLLALPAACQAYGLVTTDDGQTAFFVTTLRLKGTDVPSQPRVWRWSGGRFEIFAEPPTREGNAALNFIEDIGISGDGQIVTYRAWYLRQDRLMGISYLHSPDRATPIRSGDAIQLSHNGRYAVTSGSGNAPAHLFDLDQGWSWTLPWPAANRLGLTDDGRVLFGRELWSPDGVRVIDGVHNSGVVSPSGKWIASTRMWMVPVPNLFMRFETRHSLHLTNTVTGVTRTLISDARGSPLRIAGISAQDQFVVWGNQLWPVDGGSPLALGNGEPGMYAVSSDGALGFASTETRGFVRLQRQGPDEVLAPPAGTPIFDGEFFVVPGSPRMIPMNGPQAELRIAGILLPPGTPLFHERVIPEDVPLGDQPLTVAAPADSPFEHAPRMMKVLRHQPYWMFGFPGSNFEWPGRPPGQPWPSLQDSISFVVGGVGRGAQSLNPVEARFVDELTGSMVSLGTAAVSEVAERRGVFRVTVKLNGAAGITVGPDGRHGVGFVELGPGDLGSERGWIRSERMGVLLR
ncbi:MAG: hypothetical protein JNL98_12630 [Bryobacterales bacterium]|nr:hypothetical protein [Bryobacterales bacterium]